MNIPFYEKAVSLADVYDDIISADEAARRATIEITKQVGTLRHAHDGLNGNIAKLELAGVTLLKNTDSSIVADRKQLIKLLEQALQIRKSLTLNKLENSGHNTAALMRLSAYLMVLAGSDLNFGEAS